MLAKRKPTPMARKSASIVRGLPRWLGRERHSDERRHGKGKAYCQGDLEQNLLCGVCATCRLQDPFCSSPVTCRKPIPTVEINKEFNDVHRLLRERFVEQKLDLEHV